jgi:hypothetical protein
MTKILLGALAFGPAAQEHSARGGEEDQRQEELLAVRERYPPWPAR